MTKGADTQKRVKSIKGGGGEGGVGVDVSNGQHRASILDGSQDRFVRVWTLISTAIASQRSLMMSSKVYHVPHQEGRMRTEEGEGLTLSDLSGERAFRFRHFFKVGTGMKRFLLE